MVVLDTCALIWWTLDPESLSMPARKACSTIPHDGALISAISVWEIGLKVKRDEIDLGTSLRDYAARVGKIAGLRIVSADERHWIDSLELDWKHRDPADRLIVALAEQNRCGLVTKDRAIRDFYRRAVW